MELALGSAVDFRGTATPAASLPPFFASLSRDLATLETRCILASSSFITRKLPKTKNYSIKDRSVFFIVLQTNKKLINKNQKVVFSIFASSPLTQFSPPGHIKSFLFSFFLRGRAKEKRRAQFENNLAPHRTGTITPRTARANRQKEKDERGTHTQYQ